MKKSIVLFLFSAIGGLLPALAGGFRTVLVDAEKQPVPGAVVSFYTLPDSALIDVVTSDAEGHVASANATAMALRVQALGFLSFVSVTGEVGDTLRLDRPTNQLRELVVNARPVMQHNSTRKKRIKQTFFCNLIKFEYLYAVSPYSRHVYSQSSQ